jgi:hypothetical protein
MVDLPLTQIPPGQSPVVAAAVAGLLFAVLGAVQVVDGLVTAAVVDEATVVAQLVAATSAVHAAAATELEQARWRAAAGAKSVASA